MEFADLERRFGGLDRLYGEGAAAFLLNHTAAMVVGVGGVGSWAAEALARSGVGCLTLVDMDHVAESNINRQIQALGATLGQAKIQALAERIADINPACKVHLVDDFLSASNARTLMEDHQSRATVSWVLDCCDQVQAKQAMAVLARRLKLPLYVAGSAGGKQQGWMVQPADLRDCTHDPLLAKLRYQLRKQADWPKGKDKMGLTVFYSPEPVKQSEVCDPQAGLNCAGYGSVVGVTATMGLQMANYAINKALLRRPVTGQTP